MTRLAVLGASGHGRVVADAALLSGWTEVVFFDDAWPQVKKTGPWNVVGRKDDLIRQRTTFDGAVVAIGDNETRLSRQGELCANNVVVVSVVHPAAAVSPHASIGPGSVVFAGSVLNAFAVLGSCCILNTGATVDHDCVLKDGVHISPGAHLGGTVHVGRASWIGIGVAVREGVSIGANVRVGAGAAVIVDVPDGLTVVGVPARPLNRASQ